LRALGVDARVHCGGDVSRARVVDELPEHLFLDPEVQTTDAPKKLMHHPARQAYYLTLTDSPWRRSRDWLKWAGSPNTADEAFIRLPKRLCPAFTPAAKRH
jgi:hypothetical protein